MIYFILVGLLLLEITLSEVGEKGVRMQMIRTKEPDGLTGITMLPENGEYSRVLIFCHGLGDTADGWATMMHLFGNTDTKYILPTAPTRAISMNHGMRMPGWSDVFGLTPDDLEDEQGFNATKHRILRLVHEETHGPKRIPISSIALGGFSQGGAVALYTSLTSHLPFACVIALSTWLPFLPKFPSISSPTSKKLKILQVHGDADQVVRLNWGRLSHAAILQTVSSPVEGFAPRLVVIRALAHHSNDEEVDQVRGFLRRVWG